MFKRFLTILLVLAFLPNLSSSVALSENKSTTDPDWPMFGRTPDGNRIVSDECGIKSAELTKLWETRFRFENHAPPVVWGNKIYFTDEGGIFCQNISDRSILWKYETEDYLNNPIAVYDGKIFFQQYSEKTRTHVIVCKDALTGSDLWSSLGTKGILIDFYVLAYDHKVYFHTRDGIFHCNDSNTGKELWTFNTKIPYKPSISNNYIIFHGLVCLNATTGERVWEKKYSIRSGNSVTISENKLYIISHSENDPLNLYLLCLSLPTGEVLFKEPYDGIHNAQYIQSISVVGNKLFILKQLYEPTSSQSNFNGIVCYNLNKWGFSWSIDTGDHMLCYPTFDNGNIIVGSNLGTIMFIDMNTGKIVQTYNIDQPIGYELVIAANKLFVPTKKALFCFEGER